MTDLRLLIPIACLLSCHYPFGTVSSGNEVITQEELREHVYYLASDELMGRKAGTESSLKAAGYIASEFERYGLLPGGDDGGWTQTFPLTGNLRVGPGNRLSVYSPTDTLESVPKVDILPISFSTNAVVTGRVVFAGYGITATDLGYDDYEGIHVAGAILLILRPTPDGISSGNKFASYRDLRYKTMRAREMGAAGVIFVSGPLTTREDSLVEFRPDMTSSDSGVPAASVSRLFADRMLRLARGNSGPRSLSDLQKTMDATGRPASMSLEGVHARLRTDVHQDLRSAKNVVGWLPGHDGSAEDQVVVIGAHFDHLGNGGPSSLARGSTDTHYGADDNASGSAGLLELAQFMAGRRHALKRDVVFVAFGAEELGLLGSAHYTSKPLRPLEGTAVMVNLDMIGRLADRKLTVGGTGTAREWEGLLERLNSEDLYLQLDPNGSAPSDHASFYRRNVPVLFFHTGRHLDYHRPSDTPDKINFQGMTKVLEYVVRVVLEVQANQQQPEFVSAESGRGSGPKSSAVRHLLGIAPDFETRNQGLRVSGVADGSPAKKAGLRSGDVVIKVAGKSVLNAYDYLYALREHKEADSLLFIVARDSLTTTFSVENER